MNFRTYAPAVLLISALGLSGCTSTRFSGINTEPAPVAAAPAGVVQQSQLPPPTNPVGTQVAATDPAQFPAAPSTTTPVKTLTPTDPAGGTQVAAASGPDLTVASVVGGWQATGATSPCQMMISQTKTGSNFRAAPRRCTGEMQKLSAWKIAGKQLTLYDDGGNEIARLYGAGGGFSGQTSGGSAISLTR